MLDVTPETALSGGGGGYSAEQGENELDVPLMVICHSEMPSPHQGGRSIPVLCHGCHAVSWWSLHLVLASILNISLPPLPTDPSYQFLKRPCGVSQKERPGKGMMPVTASAQRGHVFSNRGATAA